MPNMLYPPMGAQAMWVNPKKKNSMSKTHGWKEQQQQLSTLAQRTYDGQTARNILSWKEDGLMTSRLPPQLIHVSLVSPSCFLLDGWSKRS